MKTILNQRKRVKKVTTVDKNTFNDFEQKSLAVIEFLEDDRFSHIRDMFEAQKDYIEDKIINNEIMDSEEHHVVSEFLTKVFKRSKKEQVTELSGQYKFIVEFFNSLESMAENYRKTIRDIQEEKIKIDDKI